MFEINIYKIVKKNIEAIIQAGITSKKMRSIFWSVFGLKKGKYWPEKIPYICTFHAVSKNIVTVGTFCN